MRISRPVLKATSYPGRRALAAAANDHRYDGRIINRIRWKENNMGMKIPSRASLRAQARRQLRIALIVSVVLVPLGYTAVPMLDQAMSSPNVATNAPSNRMQHASPVGQALEPARGGADGSVRGDPAAAGIDRIDLSRECLPDHGVDTACIYN